MERIVEHLLVVLLTIIAKICNFFRFLNFCLFDRPDNTVHIGLSHPQDTNMITPLSIGPEDYILVGFFFDVCGTVSGKQCPRSQGVSNFDE
jgi:hypothetical protein